MTVTNVTKTLLTLVLLAVAGVSVAARQATPPQAPEPPPASVAGKWAMALELPQMGTAHPTLELKQDGVKVTGTYTGSYGTFPLEGAVKGRVFEFMFSMNAEGTAVQLAFRGEVAADNQSILKGTGSIEGMGDVTWSATRAK